MRDGPQCVRTLRMERRGRRGWLRLRETDGRTRAAVPQWEGGYAGRIQKRSSFAFIRLRLKDSHVILGSFDCFHKEKTMFLTRHAHIKCVRQIVGRQSAIGKAVTGRFNPILPAGQFRPTTNAATILEEGKRARVRRRACSAYDVDGQGHAAQRGERRKNRSLS